MEGICLKAGRPLQLLFFPQIAQFKSLELYNFHIPVHIHFTYRERPSIVHLDIRYSFELQDKRYTHISSLNLS